MRRGGETIMPTSTNTNTQATTERLNAVQKIVHLPRTLKVAGNVLKDARVGLGSKLMFVSGVAALLMALLAPETFLDVIVAIPGATAVLDLIGIPIEAAGDWIVLALAAFNLMKLFPQDVVDEHYENVAGQSRPSGPIVDADPHR
jgi:hypothetical protein